MSLLNPFLTDTISPVPSHPVPSHHVPQLHPPQFFVSFGLLEYGFSLRKDEIEAAQLEASGWDEATINKKLAIELNNGRAAQMGILALMVHEKLDNNPYIINDLLGAPVKFN